MSDPNDPLDPSDALDQEDLLEEEISDMDRPAGTEDRTTATEQRRTRSIDDVLRRERPDVKPRNPGTDGVLVDRDESDTEAQMLGENAPGADRRLSAEEEAIRDVDEAAGAANDANDGYGDDET
jgi:hypothetical protein